MKIYPQWFIDELNNEHDKELASNGSLLCTTTNIVEFVCPKHGVYLQGVGNHICIATGEKTHGCPFCGGIKTYDPEAIKIEMRMRKDGIKNDSWGLYLCESHNIEYWQTVSNHKKGSVGCPECNRIARAAKRKAQMKPFPEWMLNEVSEEDRQKLINKDVNMLENMNFYCKRHGWYSQRIANHIYRDTGMPHMGCPKCVQGNYRSKQELQIEEYCTSLGWKLGPRRGVLDEGMELDIYLPDYNAAIEVDGSPWHTEGKQTPFGNTCPVGYHAHKDELASRLGIRILHIKDGEWCTSGRSKNNATKQRIKDFVLND